MTAPLGFLTRLVLAKLRECPQSVALRAFQRSNLWSRRRNPSRPVKNFVKALSRGSHVRPSATDHHVHCREARPFSGRGSYPVCCPICRRPRWLWLLGGVVQPTTASTVQCLSRIRLGSESLRGVCLTGTAWDKPQTPARRRFRLMPVSHSVKAWSKQGSFAWLKTVSGFCQSTVSKMLYSGLESTIRWISSFSCRRPSGSHTYLSQTRRWSLLSDSRPL